MPDSKTGDPIVIVERKGLKFTQNFFSVARKNANEGLVFGPHGNDNLGFSVIGKIAGRNYRAAGKVFVKRIKSRACKSKPAIELSCVGPQVCCTARLGHDEYLGFSVSVRIP